jgi:predicted glycosyltransferase involved in capsule biosynthesis
MRNRGISLIIIFHKRYQHLVKTLKGIENGSVIPDEVILIEMDTSKSYIPESLLQIEHRLLNIEGMEELPIAEARNLGAFWSNNEILAFLDVDCIPSKNYIANIEKTFLEDDCLYMGTPKYLSQAPDKLDSQHLEEYSELHPLRPNPATIDCIDDYGMFWSLTFFLTHNTFSKVDGFDTKYTGYGAEDTDFAFKAKDLNIQFCITPFFVYHQKHFFHRPPLNNLRSIVANCNYFYSKWNVWPMKNHLNAFRKRNLIDWDENQSQDIEILRKPSQRMINEAVVTDEPYA